MLPVDLILGDDDLAGVDIAGVADGVTQDADGSDHLAHFGGTIHGVAGVTDQLLAPGNLWGRGKQRQMSEVMGDCADFFSSIMLHEKSASSQVVYKMIQGISQIN